MTAEDALDIAERVLVEQAKFNADQHNDFYEGYFDAAVVIARLRGRLKWASETQADHWGIWYLDFRALLKEEA